ncbi:MAG: hypothetical protein QOE05_919 [Actinomycetota bacterium]|jgi:uncharacterized protein YcnI|nr:hypothetical protein [Actinomycetota bacterium]
MHSTARRTAALSGVTIASLVLLAGPAFAHVTVQSPGATQGGFTKLTFRVPTEKETPTSKLQVVFPTDAPLAFVSVKPHVGWTYTVTKGKPATPLKGEDGNAIESVVQTITWTATNGGIKPGEFDEFDVSAGPLPKVDQMVFKALQTYADGSVVRWIEPRVDGGAEPEHPAPVLKLAPAAGASPSAAATPSPSTAAVSVGAREETSQTSDDAASKSVAYTGVGLGAAGLLVALGALLRGRRPTA